MKKIKEFKWYFWLLVIIIIFLLVRLTWRLDNYLPFFLTSDGWNKVEREMNMNHDDTNISMEMKKEKDHDIHNTLIVGGGNEPGWNFEIHATSTEQNKVHIDLTTDYGNKKYLGYLYKSTLSPLQYRGNVIGGANEKLKTEDAVKNIVISFNEKECIDDAGNKHTLSVELSFNGGKILNGCGHINKFIFKS